jgi:hypothetical protein
MSAEINIYNPEEFGPPLGQYTHMTRVRANEFLFVAGMLSGDAAGNVIGEGPDCAGLSQHRGGAEISRRILDQRRSVHDISRPFAGYPQVHAVSPT